MKVVPFQVKQKEIKSRSMSEGDVVMTRQFPLSVTIAHAAVDRRLHQPVAPSVFKPSLGKSHPFPESKSSQPGIAVCSMSDQSI